MSGKRLTPDFLKTLAPGVKIVDTTKPKSDKKNKAKIPRVYHESGGKPFIESVLKSHNLEYVKELRFAKPRKFRFDFAILTHKIYIEYEGLVGSGKKGAHQTMSGYANNVIKYNLACLLGWRGIRYTSRTYRNFEKDIKTLLNL